MFWLYQQQSNLWFQSYRAYEEAKTHLGPLSYVQNLGSKGTKATKDKDFSHTVQAGT